MKVNKKLLQAVKEFPLLYVFATASRTYPDALASDVLSELANGKEEAFGKYDLMELHKSGRKNLIDYSEDYLLGSKGNFTTICPFHADSSEGSLVVTSQFSNKNMFKCFACGAGGDTIGFEQKYFNLSFKDAVYHLAYRLGLIDEKAMKQKFTSESSLAKAIEKTNTPRKVFVEEVVADKEVVDAVYRAMVKQYRLTNAHREHLIQKRNILEGDFKEYFSFPERNTDVASDVRRHIAMEGAEKMFGKGITYLSKEEMSSLMNSPFINKVREQLQYVPGFYLNKRTGKIEWIYKQGIGLLAIDAEGFARGVQVQNLDPTSTAAKYVWWSSRAKLGETGFEGGSSPGSPGGVIFPKNNFDNNYMETAPIVITEGKYKAEALAYQGNIAIYVSGVGTWKNIIPMIEKLRGNREKIYVAFDADAMGKISVFKPLKAICKELKGMGFKPIMLVWSIENGKGFDDLVHSKGVAHYKSYLKAIRSEEFVQIFTVIVKALLAEMGVSSISAFQNNKAMNNKFTALLQKRMEEALSLQTKVF